MRRVFKERTWEPRAHRWLQSLKFRQEIHGAGENCKRGAPFLLAEFGYFQYIQSINPTDPIGHYAFERAYVTNEDNIIISGSIPEISAGKVGYLLIGKNIYEAFDNIREYEKMFKEDKLAPDYSQLENEPNVYRRNAEDLGLPF